MTARTLRKFAASTLALVVCGALLSACGSSGTPKPKKGGTLNIGLVTPNSTDPMMASTVSERVLADALYDGLTAWDPKTLVAAPSLSERWQASTDGKSWIFRLKTGIVAANGDVITPFDVKTTL